MAARVAHLWRHPIKGHGIEAVARTVLEAGATMPWDRVWAVAHEAAKVAEGQVDWAPCANFSRGAKSPALMAIRAQTDEVRGRVRLTHPRAVAIEVDPDDPTDQARLVSWATALAAPGRARPAFVVRSGRGMTDSPFASVAILGLASLAALSDRIGRKLTMERFRGNIWIDGLAPWAEFDLIGHDVAVGGARLRVVERIARCKATNVDCDTGLPDVDTLGALEAGWGHTEFGVNAQVVAGGAVAVGDSVEVVS